MTHASYARHLYHMSTREEYDRIIFDNKERGNEEMVQALLCVKKANELKQRR